MSNYVKFIKIYENNDKNQGILQQFFKDSPELFDLKGSSSESSEENCILNINENSYWMSSENDPNPTFKLSFFHNYKIILSSFSLLSCITSRCVYQFIVEGSNNGINWDNICYISKAEDYFKTTIKNAECSSLESYSHIRFKHNSTNDIDGHQFPIYALELYGAIVNKFQIPRRSFHYKTNLLFLIII